MLESVPDLLLSGFGKKRQPVRSKSDSPKEIARHSIFFIVLPSNNIEAPISYEIRYDTFYNYWCTGVTILLPLFVYNI